MANQVSALPGVPLCAGVQEGILSSPVLTHPMLTHPMLTPLFRSVMWNRCRRLPAPHFHPNQ